MIGVSFLDCMVGNVLMCSETEFTHTHKLCLCLSFDLAVSGVL